MVPGLALYLIFALAAGIGTGVVYFLSLRRVTSAYLEGRALPALCLQLSRLIVLIAILVMLAQTGAPALLAFVGGLLVARAVVVRRETRRLS